MRDGSMFPLPSLRDQAHNISSPANEYIHLKQIYKETENDTNLTIYVYIYIYININIPTSISKPI